MGQPLTFEEFGITTDSSITAEILKQHGFIYRIEFCYETTAYESYVWCCDNLKGDFVGPYFYGSKYRDGFIYIKDPDDAVQFKLVWG